MSALKTAKNVPLLNWSLVYEYLPAGEIVIQRVLVAYEGTLSAKIDQHGFPLQESEIYIPWHVDVLRTSLKVAQRLQYVTQNAGSQLSEELPRMGHSLSSMTTGQSSDRPGTIVPNDMIVSQQQVPTIMQQSFSDPGHPHPQFYGAPDLVRSASQHNQLYNPQMYQQTPFERPLQATYSDPNDQGYSIFAPMNQTLAEEPDFSDFYGNDAGLSR